MFQFAYVTGPVIAHQGLHSFGTDAIDHTIIPIAELLDKVAHQQGDVFFSLAQRWDFDRKNDNCATEGLTRVVGNTLPPRRTPLERPDRHRR